MAATLRAFLAKYCNVNCDWLKLITDWQPELSAGFTSGSTSRHSDKVTAKLWKTITRSVNRVCKYRTNISHSDVAPVQTKLQAMPPFLASQSMRFLLPSLPANTCTCYISYLPVGIFVWEWLPLTTPHKRLMLLNTTPQVFYCTLRSF